MPRTGNYTGDLLKELQEQHQDELAERAEQISLARKIEAEQESTVVHDVSVPQPKPQVIDDIVEVEAPQARTEVIRVADDLEQVTIGQEVYNFKKGQKYRVPENVAFVLREAGRLWERL